MQTGAAGTHVQLLSGNITAHNNMLAPVAPELQRAGEGAGHGVAYHGGLQDKLQRAFQKKLVVDHTHCIPFSYVVPNNTIQLTALTLACQLPAQQQHVTMAGFRHLLMTQVSHLPAAAQLLVSISLDIALDASLTTCSCVPKELE